MHLSILSFGPSSFPQGIVPVLVQPRSTPSNPVRSPPPGCLDPRSNRGCDSSPLVVGMTIKMCEGLKSSTGWGKPLGKIPLHSSHSLMGASQRLIGGIRPCSRSGCSDCRCRPDPIFFTPCKPGSGLTILVQLAKRHGCSPPSKLCTQESCA